MQVWKILYFQVKCIPKFWRKVVYPRSPRPLRQLIYWAYQLTSQTESPIQFRDYFKKRDKSGKQANGRENIAQKMAELHIRQKQVGGMCSESTC